MTPDKRSSASISWYSERLLGLLEDLGIDPYLEAGLEIFQKRKVLDFAVTPGRVSAKVLADEQKPHRVAFLLDQFEDADWVKIFDELSKKSLFFAKLLGSEIPSEIESAFRESGYPLLPSSPEQLRLFCDCSNSPCEHVAGLYYRFSQAIDLDPFLIFLLRGRGKDETVFELRKHRTHLERPLEIDASDEGIVPTPNRSALQGIAPEDFWKMSKQVDKLSYNIRADELPAAILRHLEPLPLAGLEDFIEQPLEETYAKIARRAQVFGLSLRKPNR